MVAKTQACRLTDAGQRCNSSKRFIILEEHYDEFIEELKKYVEILKI
jgi:succinate-semialdehyde dehydrogenase/glutarate-semialdehyde dehydrogenase